MLKHYFYKNGKLTNRKIPAYMYILVCFNQVQVKDYGEKENYNLATKLGKIILSGTVKLCMHLKLFTY